MKKEIVVALVCLAGTANASEIIHEFKSPAFSGVGYSSHVLTIEQLESNRRQKIKDDQKAEEEKAEREYKSTNAYKFKNNLESRIYAQLSKQISDSIFGEDATGEDTDWVSTSTPFGDTIKWKREDSRIYVIVTDSNGDTMAEFDVPVGEFAF
jgi:predicted ATP-dependent endonuclease of OLD family